MRVLLGRSDNVGEGDLLAGALDAELVELAGHFVDLVMLPMTRSYESTAMGAGGFVMGNACGAAKLIESTSLGSLPTPGHSENRQS
ncbi:hypothetical protein ACLBKU_13965 [Erythrobacter sp. NE805]|uniref:hypothetical protein n=1 Tax=Erythrobacter sp. NE805 TaxID=3389875 RepID=UPI00396B192C